MSPVGLLQMNAPRNALVLPLSLPLPLDQEDVISSMATVLPMVQITQINSFFTGPISIELPILTTEEDSASEGVKDHLRESGSTRTPARGARDEHELHGR
jgi:hypothetical protein